MWGSITGRFEQLRLVVFSLLGCSFRHLLWWEMASALANRSQMGHLEHRSPLTPSELMLRAGEDLGAILPGSGRVPVDFH